MAVPNVVIHLLLLATIGMELFIAVTALRCYREEDRSVIYAFKCPYDEQGCGTADCGDGKVVRGCALGPDYKHLQMNVGRVNTDESCKKSYCTGDICNDQGLEKTGLKCYYKEDKGEDIGMVEECLAGTVGCVSALKCGRKKDTYRLCIVTKDICTVDLKLDKHGGSLENTCESCTFCDTDMCNDEGLEVNTTSPKGGEQGEDSMNGAAGIVIWGQIGIIPIGMMTLALGASLLKMLMI